MINNHDLGKRPVETLNRVAKYYLATGYSKREVRRMLDKFLTNRALCRLIEVLILAICIISRSEVFAQWSFRSETYLATGYSKREVRRMLDTFLIQCDPSASLPSWSDMLDKIAKNVDKYPIIRVDGIDVTGKEMEAIEKTVSPQFSHSK